MRAVNEVRDEVQSRAGRYHEVYPERTLAKDPSPLKVKEVWVGDHRYVLCVNEEQRRKDAADREAIVAALRQAKGTAGKVCLAVGIALPRTVRQTEEGR